MTLYNRQLVYPDGDVQEIPHTLRVGTLVDLNGRPLAVSRISDRMIVFRVYRQSTEQSIGEETVCYYLELVRIDELDDLIAQQPNSGV